LTANGSPTAAVLMFAVNTIEVGLGNGSPDSTAEAGRGVQRNQAQQAVRVRIFWEAGWAVCRIAAVASAANTEQPRDYGLVIAGGERLLEMEVDSRIVGVGVADGGVFVVAVAVEDGEQEQLEGEGERNKGATVVRKQFVTSSAVSRLVVVAERAAGDRWRWWNLELELVLELRLDHRQERLLAGNKRKRGRGIWGRRLRHQTCSSPFYKVP
jgi:hypothetical protein